MSDDNYPESAYPEKKRKPQKKITQQRLKNIALYYLKRFDSSVENLRGVLKKRVLLYARENPDFNKNEAYVWIEEILKDFERLQYLDDRRFAEIKVRSYLAAGKPARYIQNKLKEKGIAENVVSSLLQEQEYNPLAMALKLEKRKKTGPFRQNEEERRQNRQKDLGVLVRAGFDYDTALEALDYDISAGDTDDDL